MFSILSKTGITILAAFKLSVANALNLVWFKTLLFGKELRNTVYGVSESLKSLTFG